ncbi:MAG: ABC transporter ATP-binding protein [Bifidobacteriaceae bacterium]|jgi:ABC-2 type transport system ATP-binding protein|nr:ABC transporter ATP-binding protein [Bifidobacteriaceae bacterium]
MNYDAVRIRDLNVVRGKRQVIAGLDISVPPGQIAGLLGPSGSGKTTLMRAIVGVQAQVSGQVTVLGEPAGSPQLRHRVGYLTQSPSVYPDLTVHENVAYFAQMTGARPAQVADAIATVDLTAHSRDAVRRLSGGERSRVSLAATLVAGPDLLVLDEPTVGLDPVLRRMLWTLFRELADGGTTLIVSSHVMDEAIHCDRLILMRDGGVIADTTLADLLATTQAASAEEAFLVIVQEGQAA